MQPPHHIAIYNTREGKNIACLGKLSSEDSLKSLSLSLSLLAISWKIYEAAFVRRRRWFMPRISQDGERYIRAILAFPLARNFSSLFYSPRRTHTHKNTRNANMYMYIYTRVVIPRRENSVSTHTLQPSARALIECAHARCIN